jgi:hypothetical protein
MEYLARPQPLAAEIVLCLNRSLVWGFHGGDYEEWRLLRNVRRLLGTANVPTSQILVPLMMEALSSSEPSIFTRATRRNIPEDTILHSNSREKLKSYIELTGWTL